MLVRASFSRYAGQLATGDGRLRQPDGVGGRGGLRLDRSQRRSSRVAERGEPQSVRRGGEWLQPRQSDGRDVGERHRSESQGAGDEQLRGGRRSRAASEPGRAGELHVYAGVEPVRQSLREHHAAGRRRPGVNGNYTPGTGFTRHAARRNAVQRRDVHSDARARDGGRQRLPARRTSRATTPTITASRSPSRGA